MTRAGLAVRFRLALAVGPCALLLAALAGAPPVRLVQALLFGTLAQYALVVALLLAYRDWSPPEGEPEDRAR